MNKMKIRNVNKYKTNAKQNKTKEKCLLAEFDTWFHSIFLHMIRLQFN